MTLTTYSVVLRLDLSGQLSLVAGNGTFGFSGDGGPATLAQLSGPTAVAVDAAGTLKARGVMVRYFLREPTVQL
jgi:hypothetical protein